MTTGHCSPLGLVHGRHQHGIMDGGLFVGRGRLGEVVEQTCRGDRRARLLSGVLILTGDLAQCIQCGQSCLRARPRFDALRQVESIADGKQQFHRRVASRIDLKFGQCSQRGIGPPRPVVLMPFLLVNDPCGIFEPRVMASVVGHERDEFGQRHSITTVDDRRQP